MTLKQGWQRGVAFLKNMLATAILAGLLGIVFPGAGVGQTPGYGEKPDAWAPYESGRYFDPLHKIMDTYHLSDDKVDYLHFEERDMGIGYVELFRLSRSPQCSVGNCYFVLFASDLGDVPLITPCQFKQAGLAHFFNPDRSKFWGFEFSCEDDGLLQVKVTPTHFMAIAKTP